MKWCLDNSISSQVTTPVTPQDLSSALITALESNTVSPVSAPNFYPESMKEGLFFTPNGYSVPLQYCNTLLPKLRHLKLQGVHVHWSVLYLMLTRQNNVSLVSLELDYHSCDVRPSLEEFHQLLSLNSQLEILKISRPDEAVQWLGYTYL